LARGRAAGEGRRCGEIVQVGTHAESGTHIYLVEFRERLVVGCLEGELRSSGAGADKRG